MKVHSLIMSNLALLGLGLILKEQEAYVLSMRKTHCITNCRSFISKEYQYHRLTHKTFWLFQCWQLCVASEDNTIKVTCNKNVNLQQKQSYFTLLERWAYLVPRYDDGATKDEGVAHGEVCGPYNQAQQMPPSLWEHLCTYQHENGQKHTQAAAYHDHKGTVFRCTLVQQQGSQREITNIQLQ